jgi:ribosomal protein L37E
MEREIEYCRRSRKAFAAGAFGAVTLGELQGPPARRVSVRICGKHVWKVAKYSRTCTRCGFVEDRIPVR